MRISPMLAAVSLWVMNAALGASQGQPGRMIGKVTTRDKLIVLELDTGVIAPEHLFDLDHRTLRFTPDGGKYRIENVRLVWDSTFGDPMQGGTVPLRKFSFPFSGKRW